MLFLRYLTQRLGLALITLLIVSAIVFAMTAMLPGDVATRILGRAPDPQQLAILRERLGLDQPLVARYFSWLAGIVVGDFGSSLVSGQPVAEVIGRRLGKLHHLFFAFGKYDVICLIEGPDDKMMAAGALAVAAAGTVSRSETVKLMTAAEAQEAMVMAGKATGSYTAPMAS